MKTNSIAILTKHSWSARIACVTLVGFACIECFGQGNLHPLLITFDGQTPGTQVSVQQYGESGMLFTQYRTVGTNVFPSPFGFARNGGGISGYPENGTAYLQAGSTTDTLVCRFTDGSLFELVSVDLAEYSIVFQSPLTAHFVGYRPNGSTMTVNVTTDGIIDGTGSLVDFQTFRFQGFTGLTRMEISGSGFSLDNLVVAVPEPSSIGILVFGAAILLARRLKNAECSRK